MNKAEIQQLVIDTQNKAAKKFAGFAGMNVPINVTFTSKKSRVAGKAFYLTNTVEFNENYFAEQHYSNTVLHEIAHLIVHRVYPNALQAHGPEFRAVCRAIGCTGKTYHNYQSAPKKQKYTKVRVEVACACKTHLITKVRVAKIETLKCKLCDSKVSATGKVKKIV